LSPEVSVIIITKNRAHYVSSAIKSVLKQTFKDFELLVVDAASTDNTKEVVCEFHDRRVRYIHEDRDRGVSASRNVGINLSKGEFIAFLDDDDLWMSTKLEKQVDIIRKNPLIGFVSTGIRVLNENKKIVKFGIPRAKDNIFPKILIRNMIGNCSAVLVRRRCFEKVGLFDENLHAAEDFDMWIRLAKYYQFDCVQEYLLVTRKHSKSISTDYERVLKATRTLYRKHLKELTAASDYRRMLASWYCELGSLCSKCGNTKKARRMFAHAVSNDPFSSRSYFQLGASVLGCRVNNLLTHMFNVRSAASVRSKYAGPRYKIFNEENRLQGNS
jgi:glycosyltransferase involved in cell wall biosynthesis